MTEVFLDERRNLLDIYLNKLVQTHNVCTHVAVMEFLGFLSDHSKEAKRPRIQASTVLQVAKAGDIVLFRTQGTLPAIQRTVLSSEYDHVAIVVSKNISQACRSLNYGSSLYLLESTNEGVHTYPLKSRLRAWHLSGAYIVIRRLIYEKMSKGKIEKALQDFTSDAEGKSYGLNPIKLLRRKAEDKPSETYFCSELVASAYQTLGVLPKQDTLAASTYYPSSFAEKHDIHLINDAKLSHEVIVEFWQPEVMRAKVVRKKTKSRAKSALHSPCDIPTGGREPVSISILDQSSEGSKSPTNTENIGEKKKISGSPSVSSTGSHSERATLESSAVGQDNATIEVQSPERDSQFRITNSRRRIPTKFSVDLEAYRHFEASLISPTSTIRCSLEVAGGPNLKQEEGKQGARVIQGFVNCPRGLIAGKYRIRVSAVKNPFLSGYSAWFTVSSPFAEKPAQQVIERPKSPLVCSRVSSTNTFGGSLSADSPKSGRLSELNASKEHTPTSKNSNFLTFTKGKRTDSFLSPPT